MTEKQRCIYDYISNQFVLDAVHCEMIGEDKVKITDHTGNSLTLDGLQLNISKLMEQRRNRKRLHINRIRRSASL